MYNNTLNYNIIKLGTTSHPTTNQGCLFAYKIEDSVAKIYIPIRLSAVSTIVIEHSADALAGDGSLIDASTATDIVKVNN